MLEQSRRWSRDDLARDSKVRGNKIPALTRSDCRIVWRRARGGEQRRAIEAPDGEAPARPSRGAEEGRRWIFDRGSADRGHLGRVRLAANDAASNEAAPRVSTLNEASARAQTSWDFKRGRMSSSEAASDEVNARRARRRGGVELPPRPRGGDSSRRRTGDSSPPLIRRATHIINNNQS